MHLTVTTYELSGHRDVLREVRALAWPAARLVEQHIPGRLPRTVIVLTTAKGMGRLELRAENALVPDAPARVVRWATGQAGRDARGLLGAAVPTADGGAIVLLNARNLHDGGEVAETLVHELVHAVQFNRPRTRAAHLRFLRHAFELEPLTPTALRKEERRRAVNEDEAYAAEHLAARLTPGRPLAA